MNNRALKIHIHPPSFQPHDRLYLISKSKLIGYKDIVVHNPVNNFCLFLNMEIYTYASMLNYDIRTGIFCFKYWSRKKFAVLVSLRKVIKIGVLCLSYSLVNILSLMAQADSSAAMLKSHEIEQVEVTGRRSQTVFSEISRVVTVIGREDIEKAGIQNILDLLEYVSNIDIRQRGNLGVQADASIRGGGFDHVMVLVNGINLSDPQTGHLSLDLPIDHEAIERIEILEGPGARVLGPGAFTGALNIITRRGDIKSLSFTQAFGNYGYLRTQLNTGFKTGTLQNFLSGSLSSSKGFAPNTDHHLQNLYYRGTFEKEVTSVDFQAGYQHKNFGASGFYSPRFPNQYEEADVWLASLKLSAGTRIKVTPAAYWRRRKDHFLLDRDHPHFYENFHLTDVYGSLLTVSFNYRKINFALGSDLRSENILSNNIGYDYPDPVPVKGEDSAFYTKRYGRSNLAFFQETNLNLGKLRLTGGVLLNWNTAYPQKPALFPGIDLSYLVFRNTYMYASFNRALHLPTFTDLFYKDPTNQGNIELDPNRMFSGEAGVKYGGSNVTTHISGYFQTGQDMIDWVWSYAANRYAPVNLDKYRAWGLSAVFMADFEEYLMVRKWINYVSVSYFLLNTNKSIPDSVSKYYGLRHKLSVSTRHSLAKDLVLSWNFSYQDRYGAVVGYSQTENSYYTEPYKPVWIIDGAVRWKVRFLEIFAEISNLLNTRYIDAGSAIQPGRWLKTGLTVNL